MSYLREHKTRSLGKVVAAGFAAGKRLPGYSGNNEETQLVL